MAKKPTDTIANQVFIGCPYKTVRPKYEKARESLRRRVPISYIIVGRGDGQEARDLLAIIRERLSSSSSAIFDATGGNANVSLEYGLAEAENIPRAIYRSSHAASNRKGESPIIADLAGKKRNEYSQQGKLNALLAEHAKDHPYSKRFEIVLQRRFGKAEGGTKKRARALALKIVHALDGQATAKRAIVVQGLQGEGYRLEEVNKMIPMPFDDLDRVFEDTVWQPLRAGMAGVFQLGPDELPRLAIFLSAHAALDMLLIALAAFEKLRASATAPTPADVEATLTSCSEGTFNQHLQTARSLGAISGSSAEIAAEFNRVRNRFLHWKPGDGERRYRGHAVTANEGAHKWLTDFAAFLEDPGVRRIVGPTPRLLSIEAVLRERQQGGQP